MTSRRILVAVVVVVIVTVFARNCSANFVAYDEDVTTIPDEEYAQGEDQKRVDYHDAIDRLISDALNQTDGKATAEAVVKVNANETVRDEDLKCAVNRTVGVTNDVIHYRFLGLCGVVVH